MIQCTECESIMPVTLQRLFEGADRYRSAEVTCGTCGARYRVVVQMLSERTKQPGAEAAPAR